MVAPLFLKLYISRNHIHYIIFHSYFFNHFIRIIHFYGLSSLFNILHFSAKQSVFGVLPCMAHRLLMQMQLLMAVLTQYSALYGTPALHSEAAADDCPLRHFCLLGTPPLHSEADDDCPTSAFLPARRTGSSLRG